MGFYWLYWVSPTQLLHTHPWGLWAYYQSPTLFTCIALGLSRPIFTVFHITHCPWVCYSLFLSFWALLSPFAFSRPIYLFHGPVIHYSCHLDLMVFCSLSLANFSVLLSWASFLTFRIHKKDPQHTLPQAHISSSCHWKNLHLRPTWNANNAQKMKTNKLLQQQIETKYWN